MILIRNTDIEKLLWNPFVVFPLAFWRPFWGNICSKMCSPPLSKEPLGGTKHDLGALRGNKIGFILDPLRAALLDPFFTPKWVIMGPKRRPKDIKGSLEAGKRAPGEAPEGPREHQTGIEIVIKT